MTKNKVFIRNGLKVKKCTRCNVVKEVVEFYSKRNSYSGKCRTCDAEYRRKGTAPKPINIVNINGIESKECRTCGEVKPLPSFPKCKSGIGGRRSRCTECSRIQWKEYREKNRDKYLFKIRKWRLANPEKQLESQRKWKLRNPQKDKVYQNQRKARLENLRDDLTHAQWESTVKHFNYSCALSGDKEKITMDHFIPISSGKGGTYDGNVYPITSKLNNSKNNRNPFEWFKEYGVLHGIRKEKWEQLVEYLASKHDMTNCEFEDYVNSLFEKEGE